jgi:hypothetical protein
MQGVKRMNLRFRAAAIMGIAGLVVPLTAAGSAHAATTWKTSDPVCIVKAAPSAEVETGLSPGQSSVAYIIRVGCEPEFAGSTVQLNATQFSSACGGNVSWANTPADGVTTTGPTDTVTLDNDGNAIAVLFGGPNCAPSKDLVSADMKVPPYKTANTHVTVLPPRDTTPGLKVYPSSEVEESTYSSVATIAYAEFPSVYAEQTVTFSDPQLANRCGSPVFWYSPANEQFIGYGASPLPVTLDNNGNALVIAITSGSCASGETQMQVDLNAAPHTTYTAHFTILSPRPTNP